MIIWIYFWNNFLKYPSIDRFSQETKHKYILISEYIFNR